MKLMTFPRDRVISTTTGHTIAFTAGKPTNVPDSLVRIMLTHGAVLCDEDKDGSPATLLDDSEKPAPVPASTEVRAARIKEAVIQIRERGQGIDFTAGGLPKAAVVAQIVGFSVQSNEVRAAVTDLTSEENPDEEVV